MTNQQSNTVGGADMKDSEGFNIMERKHDNFSIHYCGLFIYPSIIILDPHQMVLYPVNGVDV